MPVLREELKHFFGVGGTDVFVRNDVVAGGGGGAVVVPLLFLSLSFWKPVLSVHHIKEDIQAIHMQMLRVI